MNREAKAEPVAWPEDDEHFLTASVSKDAHIVGINHPTEADWHTVLAAHISLRDRLNERIAEQDKCPVKPAPREAAKAGDE